MEAGLYPQRLMGNLLTDFIYTFPGRAYFKEAKNFTYQLVNQRGLDLYNATDEHQIIGKTIFDLQCTIMKNKWSARFVERVHATDMAVVESKKSIVIENDVFLNEAGYIEVDSVITTPVLGDRSNCDEVIGILTLSSDVPKPHEAKKIKELYGEFYNEQEANIRFMTHIGFHEGVELKLSSREMDCLIGLVKHHTNKAASLDLSISVKTLDNHLSHIKEKCELQGCSKQHLIEHLSSILGKV